MNPNTKGALLGLLAFAIYASHDVIVKYLGATYAPFQVVFFSVLFGFPLVSFMLVHDVRAENLRPRHPGWTALRTLAILVSTVCNFYAFSTLPLAQVYSILFAVPLLVTLLAIPVLGERVGLHRGGAVVFGLIGVVVVVQPGAVDLTLGHGAAMVAAVSSAVAAVTVRRVGRIEREVVLLVFPMLGSFLVMGALMPFTYKPMPLADLGAMALMSLLAFIALNCMIGAYKAGEAGIVAPMQYSQILWATLFGFLLFDEIPDGRTMLGAAIVILSGIYIVVRESRKDVSANTPVLRSRGRIVAGPNIRISPTVPAESGGPEPRDD